MKRDRIFRLFLCVSVSFALIFSAFPLFSHATQADFAERAVQALRDAMVQRLPEVTVTYESENWIFSPDAIGEDGSISRPQEEVSALLQKIYSRAVAHTGVPNQGDYLRWHIQSCAQNFSYQYIQEGSQVKDFTYTITFALSYYTTAPQEAEVTAKVQKVLSQMDLGGKTDFEKIKVIYDYICENVAYDNAHLHDPAYGLQYSAYGALIHGASVCQGYSSLFYRMALEAGVDNRIITGVSQGVGHAWNLVKLDGVYYNVDSTWDTVSGDYRFFLKTDVHMEDHVRDQEYKQPEFLAAYPMAVENYVIPEEQKPTVPETQPTTVPETQPTTVPETQPTTVPETQPTTVPETQPVTVPETQPVTIPETQPVTVPETQPVTIPETQPVTIPETQPVTIPETQPVTIPETQPVTIPETQPITIPETQPITIPETQPAPTTAAPTTEPSAEPTMPPTTTAQTCPTTQTNATAPTTHTQNPTQGPSDSEVQPEKRPETWLLASGGVMLIAVAGWLATFLGKRRK